LVSGRIFELDSGSWHLRFWIGSAAGGVLVIAEARLIATGHPGLLYERTHRARSLAWPLQENILRRRCASIARAFATDIAAKLQQMPAG
jgi:hypothetical protein